MTEKVVPSLLLLALIAKSPTCISRETWYEELVVGDAERLLLV